MPHELIIGEIYIPPLLLAVSFAYLLTSTISAFAIKLGLYKYIAAPAIAELSVLVILTTFLGRYFIII